MSQKTLLRKSDSFDYLVVGLGNPTEEYENTRHNAGFRVVDLLSEDASPYWKEECGALTARLECVGKQLLVAKPQSFMNTSGGPVSKLAKKYDIPAEKIIVIHDDLDLDPDNVRVRFGGGLAGHNGLKSISEKLCTKEFHRVKIGIGHPPGRMPVIDYVLSAPKGENLENFEENIVVGKEVLLHLIEHGLEETQNRFNRKQ
ncbi:MAG: aminoacyl-tRNA hydrolase [Streptococcus gallolyticus]|nr:aminoacyl-tRNA hydrolase [Streptococcus gallolyticus]